jgi:hypothetical protein
MMTLNVVRKTLGLSLAAGLLAASWASGAYGIEWVRRSSVTTNSGYSSSDNYVASDGYVADAVVAGDASGATSGDCATCGSPQAGCRRGCCANAWDGYCEERRGACRGGCSRGCCANAWDGYCDEQRGCNWGCRARRCKTSCCAGACNSCGCDAGTEVTTAGEGPSTPAAQPEPATQQPKSGVQLKPTTPEPPKPALDRSASIRRVR